MRSPIEYIISFTCDIISGMAAFQRQEAEPQSHRRKVLGVLYFYDRADHVIKLPASNQHIYVDIYMHIYVDKIYMLIRKRYMSVLGV